MAVNRIIKSEILSAVSGLIHGISTKSAGKGTSPFCNNMSFKVGDDELNVRQSRDKFFGSLGIDQNRLAIPQQIHSDNVFIVKEPGYYKNADGLITQTPNLYLIISTADCYSVMIYDKQNNAVGNIHSGWRGTQKKIVTKTVVMMKNFFGSKPENISVFTGPGISRDNFEVGKDVADMFEDKYVMQKNGKYFVDLKQHITDQLNILEVPVKQVEIYPACTFEFKEQLHSYRRDGILSGRMFSVIGLKQK